MKIVLCEFLDCDKNAGLKTVLWCILILGPLSCIWSLATAITFHMNYLPTSQITTSSWMWHAASLLLLFWMPLSYVLTQYRRKRLYFSIVFISGCLAAIISAIIAVYNVSDYFKQDFAMEEYLVELNKVILTKSNLPVWAIKHECCGWNGPHDFKLDEVEGDENYVKAIASCYNRGDELEDLAGGRFKLSVSKNLEKSVKKGCGRMLEEWINQQKEVICACCGLIIVPYVLATLCVYLFVYWKSVNSVKYPKHISLVSIPATSLVIFAPGKDGSGAGEFNQNPDIKISSKTEIDVEAVADTEQLTSERTGSISSPRSRSHSKSMIEKLI